MTSYDTLPYPLLAHAQTHPAWLATLALAHGLRPAPVDHCRVLEIGCASGSNLIPFACEMDGSEFVGIDLSSRQIAEGQEFIRALGLRNIRLRAQDLLDFDDPGTFDYVIAHGLYSWVPQAVRDRLMDICRRHLAPQGVAFISFNAYPGWKSLNMVRDLMLYRTRQSGDVLEKARQAGEVVNAVLQTLSTAADTGNAHASFYQAVADNLKGSDPSYVAHEFFEDFASPVYFHEFVDHARRYDLQYLADNQFRGTLNANLSPAVAQLVDGLTQDRVEREQYLDFISNRSFREVLLCRAGPAVGLALDLERLRMLHFASSARLETDPASGQVGDVTMVGTDGARHTTSDPVTQSAWQHLVDLWPQSATFDELLAEAYAGLNLAVPAVETLLADGQRLAVHLISAFLASPRLVEFTVHRLRTSRQVSERPVASPWARLQARYDARITTLRHERYRLNDLEQFVLLRLDGAHTRDMIVDQLMAERAEGRQFDLSPGEPLTDPAQIRDMLSQAVDKSLRWFARLPVLIA